ncbi:MAG: ribose-phosphate diphosphokinase [Candidatus Thermoplasmatota archaeon]|jgi:ribose-phosphate pyrophosphokinase|nr:ribose-phosphate diphosphokinase [Candidatus Thermoplasmatota archaeon]MEC7532394.1 ribose-phosphate diphosphokinase [Candidatus Thermoplasmatota archaeon]MEC9200912.1 ribose-phosphate diphosphokinase [Candidatus Thermoplasmatota archaeon]MEE2626321.1 ribose-phosphate diphosphokinase [Candidatus Thermoplasmatota archaeon]|tara:strand:- start:3357 stop:4286 length:930 start_codon:yes stop_codon:yes gene_type:complete
MPVLSGSSGRELAIALAEILEMESVLIESRKFPDGEGYVRVPSESFGVIRSEPVILVSNTFPDSGIMRTILMLEAINDIRKGDLENLKNEGEQIMDNVGPGIFLAVPYYGYARQDKRFSPGETVSARVISEILGRSCDGMVILDLHEPRVLDGSELKIGFVSSMPEIADVLDKEVNPDFILSPDKGAIDRASEVAKIGGWEFSYLEKTRIDAHTIEHQAKDLDVNGKVVAIVDDMISTGGTICRASDALRRQGAKAVYAACTHGLFTGGALSKLANHVDGVYTTDSLRNPRSVVSSAPALARGIKEMIG